MTYEERCSRSWRASVESRWTVPLWARWKLPATQVWSHLPKPVLARGACGCGWSDTVPPQIELHPEHIGLGTAAESSKPPSARLQENSAEPRRRHHRRYVAHRRDEPRQQDRAIGCSPRGGQPAEGSTAGPGTVVSGGGAGGRVWDARRPARANCSPPPPADPAPSLRRGNQAQARELGIATAPGGSLQPRSSRGHGRLPLKALRRAPTTSSRRSRHRSSLQVATRSARASAPRANRIRCRVARCRPRPLSCSACPSAAGRE